MMLQRAIWLLSSEYKFLNERQMFTSAPGSYCQVSLKSAQACITWIINDILVMQCQALVWTVRETLAVAEDEKSWPSVDREAYYSSHRLVVRFVHCSVQMHPAVFPCTVAVLIRISDIVELWQILSVVSLILMESCTSLREAAKNSKSDLGDKMSKCIYSQYGKRGGKYFGCDHHICFAGDGWNLIQL